MTEEALLSAFVVNQNGAATQVDIESLSKPCGNDQYRWVHLQSDAADAQGLLNRLSIDEGVCDALLAPETRPRAMQIGGGTLIYLRGINKNPQADPHDMVSLRIWTTDKLIITARRRDRMLMSVQELIKDVEMNKGPSSPLELLLNLVERIADKIRDTVDDIDDILIEFETQDSLDKSDRQKLADLRRQTASLRRFLSPQRDALDSLFRFPKLLTQEQIFYLREQTDRIMRYTDDLELAKERVIVLQDEVRNYIADQHGMRMYLLSMVTAVFLPLSFLTGVFGMNVGGLPGTESSDAFDVVMLSMGGLALIMLIGMLWKRWL